MVQHGTGKTIRFFDGEKFVDRLEVVTFQSEDQRDRAIAADASISPKSIMPAPIAFKTVDPVDMKQIFDSDAFRAAVAQAVKDAQSLPTGKTS